MKNKLKDIFISENISANNTSVYDKEIKRESLCRLFSRVFAEIIKFIALSLLLILAVIGIISLIYPEPRKALCDILIQAYATYLQLISQ